MSIWDLFSKRQKKIRGENPDVYQYEKIPNALRVQIVHIARDAIGQDIYYDQNEVLNAYKFLHDALCREYGLFDLQKNEPSYELALFNFFLQSSETDKALDIIELLFKCIPVFTKTQSYRDYVGNIKCTPEDAIEELNLRFKEHGVGYQFESNEIIKVDSQFLHAEAVKPVLLVLSSEKRFKGANEEFLKAHENYRHKKYKECLVESLKSFESTMKAICEKQKWQYNQNDTAKKLIDVCITNKLIPTYLQTQFSGFRGLLESGVPTIRNKLGGHGQGTANIIVSDSMASYILHLTASNILFLTKLESENFN